MGFTGRFVITRGCVSAKALQDRHGSFVQNKTVDVWFTDDALDNEDSFSGQDRKNDVFIVFDSWAHREVCQGNLQQVKIPPGGTHADCIVDEYHRAVSVWERPFVGIVRDDVECKVHQLAAPGFFHSRPAPSPSEVCIQNHHLKYFNKEDPVLVSFLVHEHNMLKEVRCEDLRFVGDPRRVTLEDVYETQGVCPDGAPVVTPRGFGLMKNDILVTPTAKSVTGDGDDASKDADASKGSTFSRQV